MEDGSIEKRPGVWVSTETGKILRSECCSCKIPEPPGFMLRDIIWAAVSRPNERDGILCIPCVERRLKRRLGVDDFKNEVALNAYWLREIKVRGRG